MKLWCKSECQLLWWSLLLINRAYILQYASDFDKSKLSALYQQPNRANWHYRMPAEHAANVVPCAFFTYCTPAWNGCISSHFTYFQLCCTYASWNEPHWAAHMFRIKVDSLYISRKPLFVLRKYLHPPIIALIIVPLLTSAHHLQHRMRIAAKALATMCATFAIKCLSDRPWKPKESAHTVTYHHQLALMTTADATEEVPTLMYMCSTHTHVLIRYSIRYSAEWGWEEVSTALYPFSFFFTHSQSFSYASMERFIFIMVHLAKFPVF